MNHRLRPPARPLRHLEAFATVCVAALACAAPARAGHDIFHIFSPRVAQGEWAVEAISGIHFGLPRAARHEGTEDDDGGAHAHDDHGHAPVRAAHELAVHLDVTDTWMAKAALGLERASGGDYDVTYVALENVFRLTRWRPAAFDAAWFTALSAGLNDTPDAIEFGPVLQLETGPISWVFNPFLEKTFGDNREPGIALSYGWRASTEIADSISIGVEGFGAVENLGNAPPAGEQIHRVGPVLYLGEVHGHEGHAAGSHGAGKHAHGPEWHGEVGVFFGLTDATPDAALKLNIEAHF